MMWRSSLEGIARLSFWTYCVLTSLYALLCSISFTWTNFIEAHHLPEWMVLFLKIHGILLMATGGLAGLSLRNRRVGMGVTGVIAVVGIGMHLNAWILSWGNDARSLWIANLIWIPYVLWEALLSREAPPLEFSAAESLAAEETPLEVVSVMTGLMLWLIYGLTFTSSAAKDSVYLVAQAWSAVSHVLIFLVLALGLRIVRGVARWTSNPSRTETGLLLAILGVGLWTLMRYLVLDSLDFRGAAAWVYAGAFALATSVALGRESVRLFVKRGRTFSTACDFVLAPWSRFGIFGLVMAGVMPWVGHRLIAGQDWNRLIESLLVLVVWVVVWATLSESRRGQLLARVSPAPWAIPVLVGLILVSGLWWDAKSVWAATHATRVHQLLHAWGEEDLSLKMIRRMFRRATDEGAFYAYLQSQTNLSRGVRVEPTEIVMGVRKDAPAFKPAIFIFVIDSLRPDYLGAYNSRVTFTPQLDAFARDSVVYTNAFTVFGATGLSEPSIWAGAHLLHKQYVKPFAPMNTLEKLIEAEGYDRYITQDSILSEILKPTTVTHPLDQDTSGNYYLNVTLKELTQKLKTRTPASAPVFVYTQPQDIHISVIQRDTSAPPKESQYEGFHSPYASRIAAFDAEFGQFIEELKKLGLYEESVIVFTADHGDSLGEGGRWGHAYTIYPEILRVPLIMHVPSTIRQTLVTDPEAPAYLIDISPTLYSFLGWNVVTDNPLLGRPLWAKDRATLATYQLPERMAVSSYGPVYGILDQKAKELYIADAVNYVSYRMALRNPSTASPVPATAAQSLDYNARIKSHLDALNAYYRH